MKLFQIPVGRSARSHANNKTGSPASFDSDRDRPAGCGIVVLRPIQQDNGLVRYSRDRESQDRLHQAASSWRRDVVGRAAATDLLIALSHSSTSSCKALEVSKDDAWSRTAIVLIILTASMTIFDKACQTSERASSRNK
ncbi:hypothetical protein MRB53_040190 [Persea americana]|nr:hypothetical protein MRB53_040190 [Persea americana]